MQRYLDSANGSPPVWRGPLQHVFPALQELEVQLDAESCVHRAVFVVLYTWPHTKDVTAKDLLPCPGVKWLRRNRDLKTFRLRAEECANFNCFLCKNDRAHMHDIVQDLSKLIRDEVVGTPTTTETPH